MARSELFTTQQDNKDRDLSYVKAELCELYGEDFITEMEQRTPGILQLKSLLGSLCLVSPEECSMFARLCERVNLLIPEEAFDSNGNMLPLIEERKYEDKKGTDVSCGERSEDVYIGDRYLKPVEGVLNALKVLEKNVWRIVDSNDDKGDDYMTEDDGPVDDIASRIIRQKGISDRRKAQQIIDMQERGLVPDLPEVGDEVLSVT
jgi:hypothetical protein